MKKKYNIYDIQKRIINKIIKDGTKNIYSNGTILLWADPIRFTNFLISSDYPVSAIEVKYTYKNVKVSISRSIFEELPYIDEIIKELKL